MPGFSGTIPGTGKRLNTDRPIGGVVMPIVTSAILVIGLIMAVGLAVRGAGALQGLPVVGGLTSTGANTLGVTSADGVPQGMERFA